MNTFIFILTSKFIIQCSVFDIQVIVLTTYEFVLL
jgi:hypothetical protein